MLEQRRLEGFSPIRRRKWGGCAHASLPANAGRTMDQSLAGLSRFAHPEPHFGLIVGQNRDLALPKV